MTPTATGSGVGSGRPGATPSRIRWRRARRRGWAGLLGLLCIMSTLAACGRPWGAGEVRSGLPVAGADSPRFRVVFPGPAPGASPEHVVRGFLRAGAASEGDYTTARQFLTPDAARAWVSDGGVVIFGSESTLDVTVVSDSRVTLSAPVIARIGADGRYVPAPAGSAERADIDFARINGEWRINGLPKGFGRWLTVADVRRLFQAYAVHYVALDRRTLIEDRRWFPVDHITSRLARAQLAPVPADLQGVATTAVPPGTRLAADSVRVVGGVATVELSVRPRADQTERQNLWAQFVATLTQDPSVVSVTLQVDGSPIDLPGARAPISDPATVGFVRTPEPGPRTALVRRREAVGPFDPNAATSGQDPRKAPGGPDSWTIPAAWTELALSQDGREMAALTKDRSVLSRWRGTEHVDIPGIGTSLSRPAYDVRGTLWVGSAPAPDGASLHSLQTTDWGASVTTTPVPAVWLKGRTVQEVRVSPEGERVAVLSRGGAGDQRLDVTGIIRQPSGAPDRLADAITLSAGQADLVGLTWVDETTVATLGRPAAGTARRPLLYSLDGTMAVLPETPEGVQLTTTDGERDLLVLTSAGQVLVRAGQLWLPSGPATDVIVAGR